MNNTDFIEGKIESLADGKGVLLLKMNDVEQKADFTYTISDDLAVELKTEIDVNNFNGVDALESINKVCADKHTGEDGVKKIWSTVEIVIISQFVKVCK